MVRCQVLRELRALEPEALQQLRPLFGVGLLGLSARLGGGEIHLGQLALDLQGDGAGEVLLGGPVAHSGALLPESLGDRVGEGGEIHPNALVLPQTQRLLEVGVGEDAAVDAGDLDVDLELHDFSTLPLVGSVLS